jgi:hypothetical protein
MAVIFGPAPALDRLYRPRINGCHFYTVGLVELGFDSLGRFAIGYAPKKSYRNGKFERKNLTLIFPNSSESDRLGSDRSVLVS